MNWITAKFKVIALCVGGGFLLRMINDYVELPWNHFLQGILIVGFILMGYWRQKSLAIFLSVFTIILLGVIEFYTPPQWNNLLKAAWILVLLTYLIIWSKKMNEITPQI